MSCKPCDDFQAQGISIYYRWKNTNIEMRGCSEHLKEIFAALTKIQKEEADKEEK